MKRKRRNLMYVTLILSILLLAVQSVSAFASDTRTNFSAQNGTDEIESEDVIRIFKSNSRISDRGNFTFDLQRSLNSESFYLTSSSTTISCSTTVCSHNSYKIALYEKSGLLSKNKGTKTYSDGSDSNKWSNLDKDKKYYFNIYLDSGGNLKGSGSISNFDRTA